MQTVKVILRQRNLQLESNLSTCCARAISAAAMASWDKYDQQTLPTVTKEVLNIFFN